MTEDEFKDKLFDLINEDELTFDYKLKCLDEATFDLELLKRYSTPSAPNTGPHLSE